MQQWDCATWLILMKSAQEEKRVVERYRENLKDVFRNKNSAGTKKNVKENYAYFPVLFDEQKFGESRETVYARLKEGGHPCPKIFYIL